MKALIIEDNKIQAHTTASHLSQCGFRCDIAYDGDTGLDKLTSNGYGLALVDIMLPKRDGIESVKEGGKGLESNAANLRRFRTFPEA